MPGDGLFLRLAALMMFFARRRWLDFESKLLTMGDMQRLSFVGGTGEVAEDVYRGLVAAKDKLLCEGAGDWDREPQGGEMGDVIVWEGLGETAVEVFWFTIGDWHLEPQGAEMGDVTLGVWEGLGETTLEVFWLTIGD